MNSSRSARGFTLTEMLMVAVICLIVLGMVWMLATRSFLLFGRGSAELAMVSEARILIDNLVADVRPALHVEPARPAPEGVAGDLLVVHRPASADPSTRLQRSATDAASASFPFMSDERSTVQHLDVRRVVYRSDPDSADPGTFKVSRIETGGFLSRTEAEDGTFSYAFSADPRVKAPRSGEHVLAGHLTEISMLPLALVRQTGSTGPRTLALLGSPTGARTPDQACLVIVRLTVRWPGATGPDGSLSLTTKIWIDERLLTFRFPEFFSSVDENLAY